MKFVFYSGENNISDQGCKHLAKAQWINLEAIGLCSQYYIKAHNSIG